MTKARFSFFLLLCVVWVLAGCSQPALTPLQVAVDETAEICLSIAQYDQHYRDGYNKGYQDGATKHQTEDIVCLVKPTYAELIKWLKTEPSIRCEVDNCMQRARDLADCAREAGFDSWTVLLTFGYRNVGHVILAFPTSDRGTVYIEPALDIPVKIYSDTKGELMDYATNSPVTDRVPVSIITEIDIIK